MHTGELGYWWRSLGGPPPPRPPLPGPASVDVAIVGAGYTGLWTAYYLKRAQPSLEIVVLEREHAGFGASGRNGGWVSGFFSGPARVYQRQSKPPGTAFAALQRTMFDTVEEIAAVISEHQIEADFLKGGQLTVALNDAQLRRLRERVAHSRAHGLDERDLHELTAGELEARLRIAGAVGASFSPHVARVHPVRLLVGLAATVEALGVTIYESTPVSVIRAHEALTPFGSVHARWVLRATEGYTAQLGGLRRALVPMNSSMIVTEPLAPAVWEEIGWDGYELLDDGAHVYVYLQRTADGRIAIGGRGVPYRFASRTDGRGDTAAATVESLRAKLGAMFPATADAAIDHAWSGVLGVPRDWCVSVDANPRSGLAWAGGYVGEGVAAANLAGRTLRDLMLDTPSSLTGLPWVGRHPPRWPPEPLRWSAIRAVYSLYRHADSVEQRTRRPSRLGRLVDAATGRE
jgi:glycine/D-amino acid oxidase-like deaminating enzyme